MWNAFGTPETLAAKDAILRAHCADVGRDPGAIERSVGCKITIRSPRLRTRTAPMPTPGSSTTWHPAQRIAGDASVWTGTAEQIADTMLAYRRVGFDTFIVQLPAPYDVETMESPDDRREADGQSARLVEARTPPRGASLPPTSRGPGCTRPRA